MKRVLIVEDDKRIAHALRIRLKAMGFRVEAADCVPAAIAIAADFRPDVVLLDTGLPASNGFTVADRLQHLPETAATPIVFITASRRPGVRERAMEMGAVRYLEKPFTAAQLSDALDAALCVSGDAGHATATAARPIGRSAA